MKPLYLRHMELNWSSSGLLPDPSDAAISSEERLRNKDLAWRISVPISRLQLLGAFFFYQLKDLNICMLRPPASRILVYLSRHPEAGIKFVRGDLFIEIEEDPFNLLELSNDAVELGEFGLRCWEKALPALRAETDFPISHFLDIMHKFRAQNFSQSNSLPKQAIAGSKAKARIHGIVNCARTIVKLEVTHRGQPIFERVIWDVAYQAFNVAYKNRDILVENGQLRVCAAPLDLAPEVTFSLDSLPEEFLKTLC